MILYSIIIPHKDSLDTIPRLLNSIPQRSDLEVILVDNSNTPITRDQILTDRDYTLYWSEPSRFAGGARNVGLEHAQGKWLVFADADDFFTPGAFDVFDSHAADDSDLIYFKSESVYDDTLEPSDRHLLFNSYVEGYLQGKRDELGTRLAYVVPWGKMIKTDLVRQHDIKFDEVLAANDMYFSTLVGYYSNKFKVDEGVVYVITTRRASLANRRDLPVIKSRYLVSLRINSFLKTHGLGKRQGSVMLFFYQARKYGIKELLWFFKMAVKYKQNLFIGMKNWRRTLLQQRQNAKKNKAYISN